MNAAPKISVLIPVYNSAQYLPECLDSVLAQDFRDVEILISDDGSMDDSLEIIKSYAQKDARIRWWQNESTLGLTGNHNAVMREARGEYVKIVHQDDKLLNPSVFSWMLEKLEQDATVSLVAIGQELIDAQSCRMGGARDYFRRAETLDGPTVIVKCLEQNTNLIGEPTATMFRLKQAQRGFNGRYRLLMDLEMWFHLLGQGRLTFLPEPLFAYRVHLQQDTATIRRTVGSAHEFLNLMTDYYTKPWLTKHITRQLLFTQIRCLRQNSGEKAGPLTADMMARLKPIWYAVYWLKRKIIKIIDKKIEKLRRYFLKRMRQVNTG